MSMLDMLQAGLGLSTLKGVTYGTMDICISIGTLPDIMTLIHEAYATKVSAKPEYIIMAREMIFNIIKMHMYSPCIYFFLILDD